MSKFKAYNKDQVFLLPPTINEFLPANHLATVIDEIVEELDTTKIEAKYSEKGQNSYHPKLLLKLLFYGYATGVRSGRKIASKCYTDLAFMYLGCMYRPDFRTINDFRKDNIEEFEKLFLQIIRICKELGMAKAGTIAIDSTKIRANASPRLNKTKEQYDQWIERIEGDIKGILAEVDRNEAEEASQPEESAEEVVAIEKVDKKQQLKDKIKKASEKLKPEEKVNLTDGDAKFIKSKEGFNTNYNCQTSVSEDQIILYAKATNGASDKNQLTEVIEGTENIIDEKVKEVLADAGYSSYENYEWLENKGITGYVPDQEGEKKGKDEPYHRSKFTYYPDKDIYVCPEGKDLVFYGKNYNKRNKQKSRVYKGVDCHNCPYLSMCSKGKIRQLNVEEREPLREKMRGRLASEAGKAKYKKRLHTIESIFGHLKYNLGYKMFSLRGLKKVNGEYNLICMIYNILKIKGKKGSLLKNGLFNFLKISWICFTAEIKIDKIRLNNFLNSKSSLQTNFILKVI